MKLAVSGCLLGEKIRFDGGHKHDKFITQQLGEYMHFVSFCPENLAFGSPRPSIRMVASSEEAERRIEANHDQSDVTHVLKQTNNSEVEKLKQENLSGIIFKAKSPSCGFGSSVVYRDNGYAFGKEDGLFVKLCKEQFPLLPMEEEARLIDPWLRENFVMQIFAYNDFEVFKASNPQMKDLVAFHQSHKFMLQSKNEQNYRRLGNIVGNHDNLAFEILFENYEELFKRTIAMKSAIGRTRNVLEHMAGFVKEHLNSVEKNTLHRQINEYAEKIIPLITPLSTLEMFAKAYNVEYLLGQKFIHPYPRNLALRSDIKSGK